MFSEAKLQREDPKLRTEHTLREICHSSHYFNEKLMLSEFEAYGIQG